MTQRRPPGPRFALPDLAARFVVFVSLACVTEFLHAAGLRGVITGLLAPPAAVLLAWHWPYAAGNRFVLAAVAPWLAYLAFAWWYGAAEGNPPGLLRVYLFNCLLMALVAAHVARSSDAAVRGLVGVARIALLVSVTSVLFAHFNPPPVHLAERHVDTYRARGFFVSPNDAAMACVLLLNFVLYRPWNQRILNWFAGAAAAAAAVFTLSKSGFVLLLASLALFLWIRRKRMVLAVVTVAVLSVLASARPIFDVFAPRAFSLSSFDPERVVVVIDRLEDAVSLVEGKPTGAAVGFRNVLWPDGIALIRDTFPHGSGFGSFHALEGSVFGSEIIGWFGVHNMYLMVAGEAGFVVFALLVFCYGGLLARAWWFSSRDGLPFAIIVVMLSYWGVIHNFLDHRFYIVSFAVAVGLLARRGAGGRAAFDAGDAAPRRTAQQRMRGPDPAPTPAAHGARTD